MNDSFEAIDLVTLAHVCGGDGGSGTGTDINGNIGVTVPTKAGNVQVGIQGGYKSTQSDYATCANGVRAMPGATPADIRANCGLPPGAQP
jgi:hypothetical protein